MKITDALREFRDEIIPSLKHQDRSAIREAWSIYIDALHRSGRITDRQVQTWDLPQNFGMKARKANAKAAAANEAEAEELVLYIDNERTLYERRKEFDKTALRHVNRGTYSSTEAPKLYAYLANEAAKAYRKEFNMTGGFSPATRLLAGKRMAFDFEAEHGIGRNPAPKAKAPKAKAPKTKAPKAKARASSKQLNDPFTRRYVKTSLEELARDEHVALTTFKVQSVEPATLRKMARDAAEFQRRALMASDLASAKRQRAAADLFALARLDKGMAAFDDAVEVFGESRAEALFHLASKFGPFNLYSHAGRVAAYQVTPPPHDL